MIYNRIFFLAALAGVIVLVFTFKLSGLNFARSLFLGINLAALMAFGYDKYIAPSSGRRVPEAVLHMLAALGGTPGAFCAMVVFRHKTRARRFRLIFFTIAMLQLFILLLWSIIRWHNGCPLSENFAIKTFPALIFQRF